MIEHETFTKPFPVNSLAVDIENVFLLERAVASLIDLNGTIDDVVAVNFSEFRGILNQSDGAVIDLAEVVLREAIQPSFGTSWQFLGSCETKLLGNFLGKEVQ